MIIEIFDIVADRTTHGADHHETVKEYTEKIDQLLYKQSVENLLVEYTRFLFTEMKYTTDTNYDPEEQVEIFLEQRLKSWKTKN